MTSKNIILREYETKIVHSIKLSVKDAKLRRELEKSETQKARLHIEESDGALIFSASYWVGVAHFENFSVHVKPKLVGSEKSLLKMLSFASNTFDFRAIAAKRFYHANKDATLVEWFAQMLVSEAETLLRAGLLRDYVEKEELIPAVKGRILYDEQIKKRFGIVDKIYCRFDEREHDIMENQILSMGLLIAHRLIKDRLVKDPFLKKRLRNLVREFSTLAIPQNLNIPHARHLLYHRLNQHYKDAHALCFLLLDNSGIRSFYESGDTRGTSFFLNMITLFEKFVSEMVKYTLGKSYIVNAQHRDNAIIRYANHDTYRQIRPDLLIGKRGTKRRLPVDAKYKLYDDKKISTADIYQLAFYARSYNSTAFPSSMIIYPLPGKNKVEHLTLFDTNKNKMGNLVALGINVPDFLDSVFAGSIDTQIINAFIKADSELISD